MVYGAVPLWFGAATIAREVLVSVAVLVLAGLGARRIDVLWVGKAGTFGLMFAYPAFLLGYGTAGWQEPIRGIAWVAGIGSGWPWPGSRPCLRGAGPPGPGRGTPGPGERSARPGRCGA